MQTLRQIAVALGIVTTVLAPGPFQPAVPAQIQTATQGATFNDALSPDVFAFSVIGFDYMVTTTGVGWRSSGRGASQQFTLPLDSDLRIQRVWYLPLGQDLLIVWEDHDGEGGAGKVVRLSEQILQPRWSAHIPAFNVGQAVVEGDDLYLTAIGFVAKLDLKTGQYAWVHENLYVEERFNDFELPRVGEDLVTFTDGAYAIVVEKQTGIRVKFLRDFRALSKSCLKSLRYRVAAPIRC